MSDYKNKCRCYTEYSTCDVCAPNQFIPILPSKINQTITPDSTEKELLREIINILERIEQKIQ